MSIPPIIGASGSNNFYVQPVTQVPVINRREDSAAENIPNPDEQKSLLPKDELDIKSLPILKNRFSLQDSPESEENTPQENPADNKNPERKGSINLLSNGQRINFTV